MCNDKFVEQILAIRGDYDGPGIFEALSFCKIETRGDGTGSVKQPTD